MPTSERRHFPRISAEDFSMEIQIGDYDALVHTQNLSASGICCKVDKQLPIMSRVHLVLMLPKEKEKNEKACVEVNGVIVREHPVVIDGKVRHYDVAIFFDDISPESRKAIVDYIAYKQKKP